MENNQFEREYFCEGLLGEYKAARGYEVVNLYNPWIVDDIRKFIKERKRSNIFYADLLDALAVDYQESDTLECINYKDFLISDNINCDTTVVSSDRTIYDDVRRDRVLPGNIKIYNGVPHLISKQTNGFIGKRNLDNSGFNTIMKTNPTVSSIRYYADLYKLGKFNLIIGVNGNAIDRDTQAKVDALYELSTQVGSDMFYYEDFNPYNYDYAHILAPISSRRR